VLAAGPAWSQTAPAAPTTTPAPAAAPALPYGAPISIAQAQALIDHAVAASAARGFHMAIAIVEPSGELVAFARMDDTQYGSIYLAQRKAETAARYRRLTAVSERRINEGALVGLANRDSLPMTGGVPIVIDGRIVGGMGVSGAASSDDEAIALGAIAAVLGH
ncbi:MAG: hypothetical protein JWR59_1289, partial [Brevundimonas sp.]|nr:hypothetical protein [Brevundimonas sp.]